VGEWVGGYPVRISGSYNFICTPGTLSIQRIFHHLPTKCRLSTKFIFVGDIVPFCIYQLNVYLYYLNNTPGTLGMFGFLKILYQPISGRAWIHNKV
jgi:hypothetical protein